MGWFEDLMKMPIGIFLIMDPWVALLLGLVPILLLILSHPSTTCHSRAQVCLSQLFFVNDYHTYQTIPPQPPHTDPFQSSVFLFHSLYMVCGPGAYIVDEGQGEGFFRNVEENCDALGGLLKMRVSVVKDQRPIGAPEI
jgi:hypothetical protein